jgi:hypothetical protein
MACGHEVRLPRRTPMVFPTTGESLKPAQAGFVADRAKHSEAVQARFQPPAIFPTPAAILPLCYTGVTVFLRFRER